MQNGIGDYASIIGIIITIVGFGVTLFQVYRSKSASLQAKDSVEQFQKDVLKYKTVSDLSEIIAIVNEIKELNRQHEWKLLIYQYSDLKRKLIETRRTNVELSKFQNQKIQDMIFIISDIGDKVEDIVNKKLNVDEFNVTKINRIISDRADGLYEILIELKEMRGLEK